MEQVLGQISPDKFTIHLFGPEVIEGVQQAIDLDQKSLLDFLLVVG